MGERTKVALTIRKADQSKFESLCDYFDDMSEGETPSGEVVTIKYSFAEVDHADLHIEQTLQEEKIPYDKGWVRSSEYDAGNEYHRLDENGVSIVKSFFEGTEGIVALDDIEKAFEMGCVDKFIEKMRSEFHVISWKDQDNILSRATQK